jgi:hypothetical protein
MTVDELVASAKANPQFDPVALYQQSDPETKSSQEVWDKTKLALNKLQQQGMFTGLSVEGVKKAAVETGKGMFGWAANTVKALKDSPVAVKALFHQELTPEERDTFYNRLREQTEGAAGTATGLLGLGEMAVKAGKKAAQWIGAAPSPKDYTSADMDHALVNEIANRGTMARAASGDIPGLKDTVAALAEAGKPIRPEKVSEAAAGSPFVWKGMGLAFETAGAAARAGAKVLGKVAGESVIPAAAQDIAALPAAKPLDVGAAARVAFGRTMQGTGVAAEKTGAGIEKVTSSPTFKTVAPLIGAATGAHHGGVAGAILGGLGEKALEQIPRLGEKYGGRIAEFGKQIAGPAEEVTGRGVQAARDILESTPAAVASLGTGAAFDAGLLAVTTDKPSDRDGFIPFGTAFGAAGAAKGMGSRIVSGQIIAPRAYGESTFVPNTRNFANTLGAIHNSAYNSANKGTQTRINAVRGFGKGIGSDTEAFYVPRPAEGQPDQLPAALEKAGLSPDDAQFYSQQQGFNALNLKDNNGVTRKVVLFRNLDAAPHEAMHAMDDVLGANAVQALNDAAKKSYTPEEWNGYLESYAKRLSGNGTLTTDPGSYVITQSGKGDAAAREKLIAGIEDPAAQAKAITDAQSAADAQGKSLWETVLTPEEKQGVVDNYIGDEIRAENGDAWMKAGQSPNTLGGKMWRGVANMISFFGGEPLAGRTTDYGQLPLKYKVVQGQAKAAKGLRENAPVTASDITPAGTPPVAPLPSHAIPATEAQRQQAAQEAQQMANTATTPPVKDALATTSDAIANNGGVKIDTTSQTGKEFFPYRVVPTKDGGHTILGWDPGIFEQNAHDFFRYVSDHPEIQGLVPFKTDAGLRSLTPPEWDRFQKAVNTFVQNQMGGFTGAGQELVVPSGTQARAGVFPPEKTGAKPVALPQEEADLINHLFSSKGQLSAVPRTDIARGTKLPRNLQAQEISEATAPGRVTPTGRQFAGPGAEKIGVAGLPIAEVNPLRDAMKKASPGLPEPKNVLQQLNVANIKKVTPAPELPQFRGNTLSITAGFKPMERTPIEIEGPDGKKYRATHDGYQDFSSIGMGIAPQITPIDDMSAAGGPVARSTTYGPSLEKKGFKLPELRPPTPAEGAFQAKKKEKESRVSPSFWLSKEGKLINTEVSTGHWAAAADNGLLGEGWTPSKKAVAYQEELPEVYARAASRGHLRGVQGQDTLYMEGAAKKFADLPKVQRQALEDLAFKTGKRVNYNLYETPDIGPQTPEAQFQAKPKEDKEKLTLTHWSDKGNLKELDPALHGTGISGEEAARKRDFPDIYPDRTYFGIKGYSKEDRLGDVRYRAEMKRGNLYDIEADPKGLYPSSDELVKMGYAPFDQGAATTVYEKRIQDAGYEGYLARTDNAVAKFTKTKVTKAPPGEAAFQPKQLVTPEREKQFKDSAVRFEDGTLKPVFHSTVEDFPMSEMRTEGFKAHFGTPDQAANRVLGPERARARGALDTGGAMSNTHAVFLDLKNPLRLEDVGSWDQAVDVANELSRRGVELPRRLKQSVDQSVTDVQSNLMDAGEDEDTAYRHANEKILGELQREVKKAGYDGVVYKNAFEEPAPELRFEGKRMLPSEAETTGFSYKGQEEYNPPEGADSYIAFDPKQIHPALDKTEANFQPPAADKIDDLEKVRNATRYQSMWMHPSGDIYNAHDSHLFWAGHNIEGAREHKNGAVEGALGKGYARLANMSGYIAAEHRGLNPKQQGAMEELANATGKGITDDRGHTIAEPSMAEAAFQAKSKLPEEADPDSGFSVPMVKSSLWTSPDGKLYQAEHSHWDFAKKYISPDAESPIDDARAKGWRQVNIFDGQKQILADPDLSPAQVKTVQRISDAQGFPVQHPVTERNLPQFRQPEAQFQAPKAEDFKDEAKLGDALKSPGWALFTATQESKGAGTDKVNVEANDQLEKELRDAGFDPIEVKGNYKGVDQGKNFIVPGMTQEQATEWGNKFGQESVLTNKGLIYNDGTLSPVNHDNTVVGKEAKNLDFYSQVPGGPAFSMGIDFARRIPLKREAKQQSLLGGEEKNALSTKQVSEMGTQELRDYYPEATVPNKVRNKAGELVDPLISSDIVNAPLIKGMQRSEAVKTYAGKLVEEAKKWIDHPYFKEGLKWYSEFTPQLKRVYGKHAQIMAELLAATSPNNSPDTNFAFANDALQGYKAGRFDKQIKKFEEGLEKVKDGSWEKWLKKQEPEGVQSEANFLKNWTEKFDLRPKQSNGKLYGMHSDAVLQVFARQWLEQTQGPKTQNFVQNLLGTGHEATIDVWADRTMRRLGYQDANPRWRILPKNSTGVNDADFALSQEVFREAAKQLGVQPDALQGGMWFAEKQHWADNAWGRLDLGDYRKEIGKVPMLESGIQQRLAAQKAQAKAKPMEQQAMFQPEYSPSEVLNAAQERADRFRAKAEKLRPAFLAATAAVQQKNPDMSRTAQDHANAQFNLANADAEWAEGIAAGLAKKQPLVTPSPRR